VKIIDVLKRPMRIDCGNAAIIKAACIKPA